ncbi:hypothetical protein KEJ49_05600 [Candidatus Bathyarchaeota archaeon]|nr:hypothetical protein [Candidatus Bathyarchaeota archaeon]
MKKEILLRPLKSVLMGKNSVELLEEAHRIGSKREDELMKPVRIPTFDYDKRLIFL